MDYDVLAALRTKENYDRYSRFVKRSSLSEEAYSIFQAMGDWFKTNDTATEILWSSFAAWYSLVRYPKMDKDKMAAHKAIIGLLSERPEVEDAGLTPLIEGLAKRDYAARIAETALKIVDGDYGTDFTVISRLVDEYIQSVGGLSSLQRDLGNFNVEALDSVTGPGLEWRMHALRKALGPVRKGDLGVFVKRPDSGGTTFLAQEMTYMAEQLGEDECILWVNNEEAGNKVRRRIVQSGIGWTVAEMDADMPKALREYALQVGGMQKIKVFDRARAHKNDIEALCEQLKPKVIVFDQLVKVHGFDSGHSDGSDQEKVTRQFNWARELAKMYGTVIVVHQMGAEYAEKKWVGMEGIFGAKTGPQGEADFILTLGRIAANGHKRYLYVPKNKMQTPGDEAYRNGMFEIEIIPTIARYKG